MLWICEGPASPMDRIGPFWVQVASSEVAARIHPGVVSGSKPKRHVDNEGHGAFLSLNIAATSDVTTFPLQCNESCPWLEFFLGTGILLASRSQNPACLRACSLGRDDTVA